MRNHSYENDFDLHKNETADRTHFHRKSFALRLVLKQRHKRTRNWPIVMTNASFYSSARLPLPVTLVTFELMIFWYFSLLLLLNYFLFNLFLFSLLEDLAG